MPLYKQNNAAELAQSAMSGATQAMAAQTKATGTRTEKDSSVFDDIYKGAAAVAYVGRGMEGLTDAAKKATDLYDQYQKRDAYDEINKAYASGGIDAIQGMGTKNYHYAQALGQFFTDRGNSEKGRSEMIKAADDRAIQEYASWKPQAIAVKRAYDSGNMQQFMPLMQQLSAQSPFPYKLTPNSDGNFDVMFRSDKDLGFVKTGTITPNAAVAEMTRILNGEQTVMMGINGELKPVNPIYNRGAILNRINTDTQNALNRTDVKRQVPLYDSKGDPAGLAIIQNPLDNYSVGPMLETYKGGKYIGTFDGYQGALQAGLTPFKKDKDKRGTGSGEAKNGIGPKNTALNLALNQAGYGFDKTTNAYYALARDENGHVQTDDKGRPVFDYEEPLTNEVLSTVINRSGGQKNPSTGNRGGNDPLGILHSGNGAAGARSSGQQPPAPAPMDGVPQQANATPTYSGNYRANMDRQANTRRALIESGDYSTEIVGLPGLGINSGALVEGDSLHGQGMLSGIGMRTTPFGQTPTEQWRQHYRR